MPAKTYSYPLTAGALIRRAVRRQLLAAGLRFTEERELLDSQFVVTGLTARQFLDLNTWVTQLKGN